MTVILREAFNTTIPAGWSSASSVSVVAGRTGNGLQLGAAGGSNSYLIPAAQRSDYLVTGFAWRSANIAAGFHSFLNIRDNTASPAVTLSFRINTDGSISAWRGPFTTLLGTSAAGAIVANTWHYIELSTRLHDTLGYVVINVDGVQKLNLTNIDTKNSAALLFERIEITNTGTGNSAAIFDDLYLALGSTETFSGSILVNEAREARQVARVGFTAATPLTEHIRFARHVIRVAYSGSTIGTNKARVARVVQRILTRGPSTGRVARINLRAVIPARPLTASVARINLRVLVPTSGASAGTATVKVWTGSAYASAPVKVWTGTAFVDALAVKTWTGSAFV